MKIAPFIVLLLAIIAASILWGSAQSSGVTEISLLGPVNTLAAYSPCNGNKVGSFRRVNDLSGAQLGSVASGGGSTRGLIMCDGTNWYVMAGIGVNGPTGPTGSTGLTGVTGDPGPASLSGTSSSIGGSLLVAGTCASTTATITGATTSMVAIANPTTYPGDGTIWRAYVSNTDTVTIKVCALVLATPTASTYRIRVIQ